MNQNTILIILTALVVLLVFVVPQILFRWAIFSILRVFRQKKAISANDARTIDELGLRPKSPAQAIFSGMQYKTTALLALRNAGVIQATEDGKLYLSEENLSRSRFRGH